MRIAAPLLTIAFRPAAPVLACVKLDLVALADCDAAAVEPVLTAAAFVVLVLYMLDTILFQLD